MEEFDLAAGDLQKINFLDPLVAILLDVGKKTHEFFKTGLAQQYDERRAAFDEFRRKVEANSRPTGETGRR